MLNDLRLALRSLCGRPGFAAIAVVTLGLGIGAGTTMFSVVNAVLLSSLPYPRPDSLMHVATINQFGRAVRVSFPDFEDLRDQNDSFSELVAYADYTTAIATSGQGFRAHMAQVSPGFYDALDIQPVVGRAFTPEEERLGTPVAVVSDAWWRTRNGETSLDAQTVRIGDDVYTVIGVMPSAFDFPAGAEIWVPREPAAEGRTAHNWSVVGRLRDGVSPDRARQDLSTIARRIRQIYGEDTDTTDASVRPMLEQLVGSVRPALLVLLGAAGVLILIACVNVANLFLARALARDREFTLRLALGARPARLVRVFLAETLLVSAPGAALGIVIAMISIPALQRFAPDWLPRIHEVAVDWRVLGVALSASALMALIIALVPAVRAARRDAREVLGSGQRMRGEDPRGNRLRSALVIAQVALTVVLLTGAGLLGRTVLGLLSVDPGFRTEGALVMDIWLPYPDFDNPEPGAARVAGFLTRFAERVRAIPGVERAGGVNHFPLQGGGPNGTFVELRRPDEIEDFDAFAELAKDSTRAGTAEFRVADADYFRTMGIALTRGRLFDARDTAQAPHVALISESLARTRWPGEDPLGKLIFFGNMDTDLRPFTVIGVVGDIREYGLGASNLPTFYADYRQRPITAAEFHLAVQSSMGGDELAESARRIAADIDPEAPIEFQPLEAVVSASVADRRLVFVLLAMFGVLAFTLAVTGIYSVMAFLALQRRPEIGVRMALGAQRGDVTRLLVRQGAMLAGGGIAAGLLAALALSQTLESLLYGVTAADPGTVFAVITILMMAVLAASWFPARRAAQVDPLAALRQD